MPCRVMARFDFSLGGMSHRNFVVSDPWFEHLKYNVKIVKSLPGKEAPTNPELLSWDVSVHAVDTYQRSNYRSALNIISAEVG